MDKSITIQHALSPDGEYKILGVATAGSFIAIQCCIIRRVGKTFGQLYQRTLERDQAIRDLGYRLPQIDFQHMTDTGSSSDATVRLQWSAGDAAGL